MESQQEAAHIPLDSKRPESLDPDRYLSNPVSDLLSLRGRTIVITGAGRGLGLAFTLAVAESGGNVAVLDLANEPHEHFNKFQEEFKSVKIKYYKLVKNLP